MNKFADMTVAELKVVAKDIGLTGYSKMRKQELIDLLTAEIPQDGKDPIGRFFDDLEQEAVRLSLETGKLHGVDRTGSISDESLKEFQNEVKRVIDELDAASEAEREGYIRVIDEMPSDELEIVQTESIGRIIQPEAYPLPMNRAMRRKKAALARRSAKRVA